jgi:hypothetical protein
MKYNYLGPYIHGVAEYRINGEVGYVNKKSEKVHINGEIGYANRTTEKVYINDRKTKSAEYGNSSTTLEKISNR